MTNLKKSHPKEINWWDEMLKKWKRKAKIDGFCSHGFKSVFPHPHKKGKFMVGCSVCGKTKEWKAGGDYEI